MAPEKQMLWGKQWDDSRKPRAPFLAGRASTDRSCLAPAAATSLCQVNPCPSKALSVGFSRALSTQRVKSALRAGFVPVCQRDLCLVALTQSM